MTDSNKTTPSAAAMRTAHILRDVQCDFMDETEIAAIIERETHHAELVAALEELVRCADPVTNMSDLPVFDALARARAVLAKVK